MDEHNKNSIWYESMIRERSLINDSPSWGRYVVNTFKEVRDYLEEKGIDYTINNISEYAPDLYRQNITVLAVPGKVYRKVLKPWIIRITEERAINTSVHEYHKSTDNAESAVINMELDPLQVGIELINKYS